MMRTKQFWQDLGERSLKTFAQALLATFAAGVTVLNADWQDALAIAATAALISVLTSIASAGATGREDASALPAYVGQHRKEE